MIVPSVESMLVAGRALFLIFSFVTAAVSFTAWRRATREQTEQVLAHNNVVLQRLAALEARIDATRSSISQLGERVERPQPGTTASAAASGYHMAIRLAKGGASQDELMSGCGVSLHEAQLLRRLHTPRAAPRQAAGA
jgi:hypothetical protein